MFIREVAAVEGNSYEFSDDTFANDEQNQNQRNLWILNQHFRADFRIV